jgi:gas vesicle protein
MRQVFGFFIGIFSGWLVGTTIALLLAPESGADMRGMIRSRSANFLGEIKSAADQRREQLEKQLAEMRTPRLTVKEE